MVPQYYLKSVNYRLDLPPWHRLREMNLLAKELKVLAQNGLLDSGVEKILGTPEEAANKIQYKYPAYEKSPYRILPLFFCTACGLGFLVQLVSKFCYMRRNFVAEQIMKGLDVPEFLFSSEYVSYPEKAVAAPPVHSPEEIMLFCGLGVIVGLVLYFWLSYLPQKN